MFIFLTQSVQILMIIGGQYGTQLISGQAENSRSFNVKVGRVG